MNEEGIEARLNVDPIEAVRQYFSDKFGISSTSNEEPKKPVIPDLTFEGLCKHWKETGFKKIITMVGAGISTSAGIPDFRSPGSGLYNNLEKYNLPHPTAIFDMDYFKENPEPFFTLAKELYPGKFNPTPAHYFVRMLNAKNLLVRHYTQNIDTLERIAGIPDAKLVEAHGTFFTNHCMGCQEFFTMEWMKEQIMTGGVPKCPSCQEVVKPDIVFFGENLPNKFYKMPQRDFKDCDLLIIMGTSLEVQPFASLIDKVGPDCVRLLINRDKVGLGEKQLFTIGPGLMYDTPEKNTRDVAYIGNCDDGVYALADALGWGRELRRLVKSEHARLEWENASEHGSFLPERECENEMEPISWDVTSDITSPSQPRPSEATPRTAK